MNEQERQALAEHLAKMSYRKARAEVRRLDKDANLKYWRNSVKNEWHTLYELPNQKVRVILVEVPKKEPLPNSRLEKVEPVYVEARVEALAR
jgi:hypothetical protein